ncbi:dihydroorotate dehydrogenase-like protein [Egicoccus sp. AB-alg6-2]|uniref:dihydroorotate dehydrogenase-like protein n=1 Tax=Egicoccus sp. AB-alg6-2 TaxID=3242692 RepID=UPI00359DE110
MDLTTDYLGLRLRSPLVASSGPFTGRVDSLRELQAAGVGAVVLPSLFEEQVIHDELQTTALFLLGEGGNPEASSYFPDLAGYETVCDRYLRLLGEAKDALDVPVVASLNGTSGGGWTRYAAWLEEAGADAIELNLYRVAADVAVSAAQVEAEQLEMVASVAEMVSVPVAVKVGPHYTAFADFARRLVDAGARGLVLFNRFYQPDIDPFTRRVVSSLALSSPEELRLPLRWTALLHGWVDASLALTTGVHSGLDAARALLAGADVAMMTSSLLRHGPAHVATVEAELTAWARELGVTSIAELRGSASQRNVADPEAFERANYVEGLVAFANSFDSAQGGGPW